MRTSHFILVGLILCGLLLGQARAENFQLKDGSPLVGDPISPDAKGVVIRFEDGKTSDRTAWEKFSQDSLKKLQAKFPKFSEAIEQFIEPTEEEVAAATQKTALVIKSDYPKLERPERKGLIRSVFSTGLGWTFLFLFYLANIYAGYEVSIFRARPPGLVCGVSAVAPVIGPIVFLCLPTQVEDKSEIVQEPAREKEAYYVGDPPQEDLPPAELAVDAGPQLPPTEHFPRGQYTFNRRFFETKFPGFMGVTRRDAEKDMELIFVSQRGTYNAERIARVGIAELYVQVTQGTASTEVMIPFLEIQEVILKHKDA